jgi:hypothetical protein
MSIERWSDERLDRLAETVERQSTNIEALARIAQLQQDNTEGMRSQIQESNIRFTEIIAQITENLTELRAGQERQERLLDYLIRRDGERGETAA